MCCARNVVEPVMWTTVFYLLVLSGEKIASCNVRRFPDATLQDDDIRPESRADAGHCLLHYFDLVPCLVLKNDHTDVGDVIVNGNI